MNVRKPYSPERLENYRRMKKARRLFKKNPVFAFQEMLKFYPNYTNDQFLKDLTRRSKPKRKEKKVKRNTKYAILSDLYWDIRQGDDTKIRTFVAMLRNINKPFIFNVKGKIYEVENTTSMGKIQQLASKINDPEAFEKCYEDYVKLRSYGK